MTQKSFNFARKFNLPFYFVSAADGTNVVKVKLGYVRWDWCKAAWGGEKEQAFFGRQDVSLAASQVCVGGSCSWGDVSWLVSLGCCRVGGKVLWVHLGLGILDAPFIPRVTSAPPFSSALQ